MNKKSKAFTMAEVILVMTILGIIAAVMVTTLKPAEYKAKGLAVLAKKVMSQIDAATTQIIVNNTKMATLDSGSFTLENYKKYLTALRTAPASSFCTGGAKLKDGSCIAITVSTATVDTYFPGETAKQSMAPGLGVIKFDINDSDEPNTLGIDQFTIPVNSAGIQY